LKKKHISSFDKHQLDLKEGNTNVLLVGTGGRSFYSCSERVQNPWWIKAVCKENAHLEKFTTGITFCKFNYNGDPRRAYCYTKDPTFGIYDDWYITSSVNPKNAYLKKEKFFSKFK